jgi:hypothetical protein
MVARSRILSSLGLLAFLAYGCELPQTPYAGPCVVTYGEPALHITSAVDADSGDPIPQITISRLVINGQEIPLEYELWDSNNIEYRDSVLVGTIPCSFGYMVGTYVLTISAEGYSESVFEFRDVHYSVREGPGCPLHFDGGTRVQISLKGEQGAS